MGLPKEIDQKMFIFRVNLGIVTPKIDHLGKSSPGPEGFNTHLWVFEGDRRKNVLL